MSNNEFPIEVSTIENFFIENELWYNLTRNIKALSCKDAARKRKRLGHIGIPLCDELKSNLGYIIDNNGEKTIVILHCRGNQFIDIKKICRIFNKEFIRLDSIELEQYFGLKYGLINPFIHLFKNRSIVQIFDESIFKDYLPPYTMMTNAGDFEWGIEFKPRELVNNIPLAKIENIIIDNLPNKFTKHHIGILTGNSPESGIVLWQIINEKIRLLLEDHFLGDISFPPVLIESLPEMGLSMELNKREKESWKVVKAGITNLCRNGATIIAVACNTSQYFSREISAICSYHNAAYISIEDAVYEHLKTLKINEFDFLGIEFVIDFNKWSAFKKLDKKYKIIVPNEIQLQKINDLAFQVKRNNVSTSGRNKLRDLINKSTKTDHVIIALTELSILWAVEMEYQRSDKNYIDTLSLLANTIAKIYVENLKPFLFN